MQAADIDAFGGKKVTQHPTVCERSIIVLRSATVPPGQVLGPSAPSKKSFTSVNSPILACKVFTSIAGSAGSLWVSDP